MTLTGSTEAMRPESSSVKPSGAFIHASAATTDTDSGVRSPAHPEPRLLDLPARRLQADAILTALALSLGGVLLGRTNDRYLTCGDFVISGNYQPANCRPGAPTTKLLPDH